MANARGWWLSLILALCVRAPLSWAQEASFAQEPHDRVEDLMTRYNLHPAFEKLGRGLSNALGGWLEIPLNIHTHYTPTDVGASFCTGLVHGVFKGVVRTGVGVYEAATFFLPYPEQYAPILPTLAYFQRSSHREPLPLE